MLVVSVIAWATHQTAFTLALAAGGAALAGLLSAWAGRSVTRRLGRAREISRAWLYGNLSLRIADPVHDDVGLLAAQLDLLAEHLEQDERDLAALRERNARLTDQVRALTVVEERNRLARELHDSVKQSLFSLTMTASGIRARLDALPHAPDDLAEMVREVEASAQSAQREMTRLIEDLRSKTLQEQGLAATLNDYTLLCGAREHLLVYLDVQGNDALLPPSVAEALYRVAQEALHNVTRHARATRADVNLRCLPEQVMLTIRDNGVGFDTGQAQRGLGLANMQERVMSVGGRLVVESQPGAGTTVLVQVGLTPRGVLRTEIAAQGGLRPNPGIENWAWLGQRLVIPVGQTWPWLPADQVHLRRPLVEADEKVLLLKRRAGLLGLRRVYVLQPSQCRTPLVRVSRGRSGYEWKIEDAAWTLRHVRGLNGRMVLQRKGQPLAAMQYQGRQLNTWSEIVYDGRGYRLSYVQDMPCHCILVDETGAELLLAQGDGLPRVTLRRALPLPLLVMVALRIVDEMSVKIDSKT
jgi:signal transduction histidine kinase